MTQMVVEDVDVDLFAYEETDDPSVRTHIVNSPNLVPIWEPGMTAEEALDIARLRGLEVTALCGYKWVPKHNPDKFDVCDPCFKIAQELMAGAGE